MIRIDKAIIMGAGVLSDSLWMGNGDTLDITIANSNGEKMNLYSYTYQDIKTMAEAERNDG